MEHIPQPDDRNFWQRSTKLHKFIAFASVLGLAGTVTWLAARGAQSEHTAAINDYNYQQTHPGHYPSSPDSITSQEELKRAMDAVDRAVAAEEVGESVALAGVVMVAAGVVADQIITRRPDTSE